MSTDAYLMLIGAALFLFGVGYAWYITHSPIRPGLQCEGVVAGCAVTLLGATIATLISTGDWQAVQFFWGAFALTGTPMLVFKRLQDEKRKREADHYMDMLLNRRASGWPDAD